MDIKDKTQAETPTTPVKSQPEEMQGLSPIPRLVSLVVGDALIFLIFAAIGRSSHKESSNLWQIALTALPFAAGWFLVSPFIGAFRRNIDVQPRIMSLRTALAWLAAWPIGLLFRGFAEGGVPPVSFAIVTLITNAILLEAWRLLFSFITRFIVRKR